MKAPRRLALNAERLAELTTGELRGVVGGASIVRTICFEMEEPRDPSDFFVSVCDGCLTRTCI